MFDNFLVEPGELYKAALDDLKQAVLDGRSVDDAISGIRVYEKALADAGRYKEAAELRDVVNDWHNGTLK